MRLSCVTKIAAAMLVISLANPALFARQHEHKAQQEDKAVKLATDLVSLNVLVSDHSGRAILGLKKENFKVYEDGVEQQISFFSADEAPVSWGLILDRSGSMMGMMRDVYRAAVHVVDEGTEQDEIFAVAFNKEVEMASDFTSDKHRLENSLLGLRADGGTALWDAVVFGLNKIEQGKHRKKVLVVITDGEDNASSVKIKNLIERVEEEDVLIYMVGMFESGGGMLRSILKLSMHDNDPQPEMEKLAQATGARAHFPKNVEQCKQAMKEIAREVSQQYSLGYYPTNTARDGKWRKIRVSAGQEEGQNRYAARARAGYYAPRPEEVK